jgi:hypothetical protein
MLKMMNYIYFMLIKQGVIAQSQKTEVHEKVLDARSNWNLEMLIIYGGRNRGGTEGQKARERTNKLKYDAIHCKSQNQTWNTVCSHSYTTHVSNSNKETYCIKRESKVRLGLHVTGC